MHAVEHVLAICIRNGFVVCAREIADLIGRELTLEELSCVAGACMRKINLAERIGDVLRPGCAHREPTVEQIDSLVASCIFESQPELVGKVLAFADRQLTVDEQSELIIACSGKGSCGTDGQVHKIAQIAIRQLTTGEREALLAACFNTSSLDDMLEAVKLAGRRLSTDELNILIRGFIANDNIDDAIKAAQLLP